MKTQVMRRSDRDKKAAAEDYAMPPMPRAGEDYPYGLRLCFTDEVLKKLGIDGVPKPGDKYRIEGEAHVTAAEQRDTDKNSDRRVELVLHELGVEPHHGANGAGNSATTPKTVRQDLEDARHQARGSTAAAGRIGARVRS